MTRRPMNKPRKFRGFAVLERPDGALVWGTFRPTEAEARAIYDRWNPSTEGHPRPAQVYAVEILLIDKIQPETV